MKTEIFISGAGIPGLTLALHLAKLGYKITLADPMTPPALKDAPHGTRSAAVMAHLLPLLLDVGAYQKIEHFCSPLKALKLIDPATRGFSKPLERLFKASEIDQDAFSYNIPNMKLLAALGDLAKKTKNITCLFGRKVKSVEQTQTQSHIHLDNNEKIDAFLVVGADGRNSAIRHSASIKTDIKDYKQTAITCILSHTKDHDFISTEFHKDGGPFTLVPLPDKRSSLVWVEKKDDASQLLKLSKNQFIAKLQENSHDILGKIDLVEGPDHYPLSILRAKQLTAHRCVLIAEAAHVVSPIGAQGLNMSLTDVKALIHVLTQAKQLGLDIGSKTVLDSYLKERAQDIFIRQMGTDLLNRNVRSSGTSLLKVLRRIGLHAASDISPIRKTIMDQGFGG